MFRTVLKENGEVVGEMHTIWPLQGRGETVRTTTGKFWVQSVTAPKSVDKWSKDYAAEAEVERLD